MQLATTLLLFAFATYVHADQCMPCAGIVDGQTIIDVCDAVLFSYTGGDEEDTGPYCAYYVRARPRSTSCA
ncbi:hypothetical protein BKA83DRAFT_4350925 [Pisolithus microcarpus]|nr:hypothetical protein BKA83DRAFT_4350925 [Pisolithus microcarpus]